MSFDELLIEGEAFLLTHPLADREQLRKYLMRFDRSGVSNDDIRDTAGVSWFFGGIVGAAAVSTMLFFGDMARKEYAAKVDKAVRILWKKRRKQARG